MQAIASDQHLTAVSAIQEGHCAAFRRMRRYTRVRNVGEGKRATLNHPTLPFLACVSLQCATRLGRHSERLDGSTLLV
jgi:hypothetical protein